MASLVNALTLDSMVTPLWFKIPFVGRYQVFYPEQRNGLLFHAGLILLLAAASLWGLNQATRTQIGPVFLLYLLPALMALALLPLAVYRAFALLRAYYIVERDGIRLHWGLRVEDIPMSEVLWIKGAKEAGMTLPLPWLHLPGAILGLRKLSNGTPVEYLAADRAPESSPRRHSRRIPPLAPRVGRSRLSGDPHQHPLTHQHPHRNPHTDQHCHPHRYRNPHRYPHHYSHKLPLRRLGRAAPVVDGYSSR